jgi:hypothetical protein
VFPSLKNTDSLPFDLVLIPVGKAGFSLWCVNRSDRTMVVMGHGDTSETAEGWGRFPRVLGAKRGEVLGEWSDDGPNSPRFAVVRWVDPDDGILRERICIFSIPGKRGRCSDDLRQIPGLDRKGILLKALGMVKAHRVMTERKILCRDFEGFMEKLFDRVLMLERRFDVDVGEGCFRSPGETIPFGMIEHNQKNEALFSFLSFSLHGFDHEGTLGMAIIRDENNPSGSTNWTPGHVREELETALSYLFSVYRDSLEDVCPWNARCGRDVPVTPVMEGAYDPGYTAFYTGHYSLRLQGHLLRDQMVFIDRLTLVCVFLLDGFLAWEAGQLKKDWCDYYFDCRRLPKQHFYTQGSLPYIDPESVIQPLPDFKSMPHPNMYREGRFRTWTDFGQRILWFFEERLNREGYCPVTHHFAGMDRAELYAAPKDVWPELYPGPDGISPYVATCLAEHWNRDRTPDWLFPYGVRGDESIWVVWPGRRNVFVMRWVPLTSSDHLGCFPTSIKIGRASCRERVS